MRNNSRYKYTSNLMQKTRTFLRNNNLTAVPSDKSNRLVITDLKKFETRVETVLNNTDIYKPLLASKCKNIENEANSLIRKKCNSNPHINVNKLLACGSRPARFYCTVKDHKDQVDDGYPLRPIASAISTPTEKIDWLLSQLLGQLIDFVPANINSTLTLIESLKTLSFNSSDPLTLISLDVKNLYNSH